VLAADVGQGGGGDLVGVGRDLQCVRVCLDAGASRPCLSSAAGPRAAAAAATTARNCCCPLPVFFEAFSLKHHSILVWPYEASLCHLGLASDHGRLEPHLDGLRARFDGVIVLSQQGSHAARSRRGSARCGSNGLIRRRLAAARASAPASSRLVRAFVQLYSHSEEVALLSVWRVLARYFVHMIRRS
jgi:hypothetical protein